MNFKPERVRIPFGAVLLAAVFTLATFVLLPLLESASQPGDGDKVELRTVDTVRLEPPPPSLPEREPAADEPDQREAPKPELEQQRRRMPLSAMLELDYGLGALEGDFALDFDILEPPGRGIGTNLFELGELDRNPVPIVRTPPIYPIQAKMRRIEGMVLLEFVVDRNGQVRDVVVSESRPGNVFVNAARRTVEKWKFEPGIKDGRPVPVRVQQKLTFRLE